MVSKASELLPDPDTPLTTVSLPWGISQEMFFRLCVRAPRMMMASFKGKAPSKDFPAASQCSQRGSGRNRPFFIINCAATPPPARTIRPHSASVRQTCRYRRISLIRCRRRANNTARAARSCVLAFILFRLAVQNSGQAHQDLRSTCWALFCAVTDAVAVLTKVSTRKGNKLHGMNFMSLP